MLHLLITKWMALKTASCCVETRNIVVDYHRLASAGKTACTIDVNVSFLKTDGVDVVAVVSLCYVPDDA